MEQLIDAMLRSIQWRCEQLVSNLVGKAHSLRFMQEIQRQICQVSSTYTRQVKLTILETALGPVDRAAFAEHPSAIDSQSDEPSHQFTQEAHRGRSLLVS